MPEFESCWFDEKMHQKFSLTNISPTSPIFYGRLVEWQGYLASKTCRLLCKEFEPLFPTLHGWKGEELLVLVEEERRRPKKAKAGLKSPPPVCCSKDLSKGSRKLPDQPEENQQKWAHTVFLA